MPRLIERKTGAVLGWSALVLGGLACGLFAHSEWWGSRRPDRQFERGWRAFEKGDLRTLERLAVALEGTGDYEPQARLLRGAYLVRLGMHSEALGPLGEALAHEETKGRALLLAGQAWLGLERPAEGQQVLRAALAELPEHPDVHRWLAIAYYDTGASLHALEHLDALARLAPDDGRPLRLAGLIHKDDERFSRAVEAYRESLRRDPRPADREEILLELAESLMKLRLHDEALGVLAECRESAASLALQAECRHGEGHMEEARRLAERALELDAGHPQALLVLGAAHLEAGDVRAARDVLLRAAEAHPKDPTVRFRLSQAHGRLGETEEAEAQLEIMEILQTLRTRFTELHHEAMEKPQDAGVRYELGVHARELGKVKLAEMWFQAALALDPTHAAARRGLAGLAHLTGVDAERDGRPE